MKRDKKERITITLDSSVLRKVDRLVNGKDVRNRSHAIEQLVLKSMDIPQLDTVLIMAGGEGVKLRPITYEIPKPLIPIHGKPILEHQISMLKKNGVRNLIIAVGYMYEKIVDYFGDGSKFGVNINYIVEQKPLGTAGALKLAEEHITDTFGMLNVDTLMDPDIQSVLDFHKKQGSAATLLLRTSDDISSFGVVKMRGNQILEFVEKPRKSEAPSNLISTGFHIFEPDIIKYVQKGKFMIEDLFDRLAKEGHLCGFVHDGTSIDVSTTDGYERAIKQWKDIK
ncbi:MAG: NTP transferase domain-containing protein [Candidatus Aenigmarchaeota archaeon]|nr:NTP transferase domain-containing protein [Candidatus Aenigmarchaeota archaeon]